MANPDHAVRCGAGEPGGEPAGPQCDHLPPGRLAELQLEEFAPIGKTVPVPESAAPFPGSDRFGSRRAWPQPRKVTLDPGQHNVRPSERAERLGDHWRMIEIAVYQVGPARQEALEDLVERRIR